LRSRRRSSRIPTALTNVPISREQYCAIGWVDERLSALIFEVREDQAGDYYHLVTLWRATRQEQQLYEELSKSVAAETIARLADDGKDVSRFFMNTGRMMAPIQRVNVDFASAMLEELDNAAKELNISRQAVIKTLIRPFQAVNHLGT
jgi:hypothetical protein